MKFVEKITISHLDGSKIIFTNAKFINTEEYEEKYGKTNVPKCKVITEHCGEFDFFVDDLKSIMIEHNCVLEFNTIDKSFLN